MRFKMYYSGKTDIDLNKYFNEYFLKISKNMKLEIN